MSALSALRPMHWIGLGLIVALLGSGALSSGFGLLGGNTSKTTQLTACLDRHGINVASVAAAVGNPATLLSGAHVVDSAVKHGKLKGPAGRAAIACIQKVEK